MIHLERLDLREVLLPLAEPFTSASGTVAARRVLLLTMHDGDGGSAWSECVAESVPSYHPDTVDTCWIAISEWLGPRLLARGYTIPAEVFPMLSENVRGHRMAIAALEMGTWALAAVREGVPLAELLARSSRVAKEKSALPREHVETGIAIGMHPEPESLAARAQAAVAEGYRRIRIKIAPGRDVEFIWAIREALGPDVSLVADANGSYTMADSANVRALHALDGCGLSMLEQPLGPSEMVLHAELQRHLACPIALDESIGGIVDTRNAIALGSGRAINIKPGRVGGLGQALAIHDLCARSGMSIWCGGMLETGIGRAYNVSLASLPHFTEPGDLAPSARYWARDIVNPEWTMSGEGRVRVPLDRSGMGVGVDEAFIDDITVRMTTLRG